MDKTENKILINKFLETNFYNLITLKEQLKETQENLNCFVSFWIDTYKGTTKENLTILKIITDKFLDTFTENLYICISKETLQINLYNVSSGFDIEKAINDLILLNDYILNFEKFIKE